MKPIPLAAALLILVSAGTEAAVMVDSIGASPGTGDGSLDVNGKALVFTTGSFSYTFDSAVVRILSGSASPTLTAGIYSSVTTGGNIKVGAQVLSLTVPVIPISASAAAFTLTPANSFTLAANTTYFFVIYGAGNPGTAFKYDSALPAGTSDITFPDINNAGGNQFGWYYDPNPGNNTLSNPSTWSGYSANYNDLQINVTLVPEPSALMLAAAAAIPGLRRRRGGSVY